MKHMKQILLTLAVAAFAVGCRPSEEKSTAEQLNAIKTEAKEVAQDVKDYSFAQKAEFTEKMQSQLREINQDLDQLAAKIERSTDAAKAEAKPKLQKLRDQTEKLTKQLEEAKHASESTWDDVKAAFRKGYAELKDGFQQARQWVSDKISP